MIASTRIASRRLPLAAAIAAQALLAGCGGHGLLVSRGTAVPLQLQHMTGDQLHDYFKATGQKAYTDGSVLDLSAVMVDLSYLKSTGQTMEASAEEMQALGKLKRFEVQIDYRTRTVFPGATDAEGISIEKWTVTLRDSTGAVVGPSTQGFDTPLVQKSAVTPEEAF